MDKYSNNSLQSLLECPVCYEIKRDERVYQCTSGHLICSSCKSNINITSCPTCRGLYYDPPIRSLQIEKVIAESGLFEFSCKFGCGVIGNSSEALARHEMECILKTIICLHCSAAIPAKEMDIHTMEQHHAYCEYDGIDDSMHLKRCQFRMVMCPTGYCGLSASVLDVNNHLRAFHSKFIANCFETDTGEIGKVWTFKNSNSSQHWACLCKYRGLPIVLRMQRCPKEGTYSIWVKTIFGDKSLAKNFAVDISVAGNGSEFRRRCALHPVDVEDRLIRTDIDCFQLSERNIMQCRSLNISREGRVCEDFPFKIVVNYRIFRRKTTVAV